MDVAAAAQGRQEVVTALIGTGIATVIVVVLNIVLHEPRGVHDLGFLTGAAVVDTVPVWAITFFIFARRCRIWQKLLAFVAILVCAIVCNVLLALHDDAALKAMPSDLKSVYGSAKLSAQGRSAPPIVLKSSGDPRKIAELFRQVAEANAAEQKAFIAEINGLGCSSLIATETLNPDIDFTARRATAQKCQAVVARHKAAFDQSIINNRALFADAGIADHYKVMILKGFDETAPQQKRNGDTLCDLQSKSYGEIDEVLALLAHPHGPWLMGRHGIAFKDGTDLQLFNQHIAALAANGREAERISAAAAKISDDAAREMQGDSP